MTRSASSAPPSASWPSEAGKPKIEIEPPLVDEELYEQIRPRTAPPRRARRRSRTSSSARTPPRRSRRRCWRSTRADERDERARAPRRRPARVRQAREGHHPPPDRGRQAPPGRPRARTRSARSACEVGSPRDARLRALHARPDAGLHGRDARHEPRGAAARHARARDLQALHPPLQLPALLGGGGRLHARAEAPRHRPRRARRAGAAADDPVGGGVPLHDPRRLRHPRVERVLVDGLGLRLDALADGRGREDPQAGRRESRWA